MVNGYQAWSINPIEVCITRQTSMCGGASTANDPEHQSSADESL
jgi:hypothetical protein